MIIVLEGKKKKDMGGGGVEKRSGKNRKMEGMKG